MPVAVLVVLRDRLRHPRQLSRLHQVQRLLQHAVQELQNLLLPSSCPELRQARRAGRKVQLDVGLLVEALLPEPSQGLPSRQEGQQGLVEDLQPWQDA